MVDHHNCHDYDNYDDDHDANDDDHDADDDDCVNDQTAGVRLRRIGSVEPLPSPQQATKVG